MIILKKLTIVFCWPQNFLFTMILLALSGCGNETQSPPVTQPGNADPIKPVPIVTPGDTATLPTTPTSGPLSFTRQLVNSAQAPWGKNLADVDRNGFLDIIVGGGYILKSNIYWYQYPDWTTPILISTTGGGDDLSIADINGDGAMDVIVNGGIYWLENPYGSNPKPDLKISWTLHNIDSSNKTHDLAVGDINGDKKPDVVARVAFGPTTLYIQDMADTWNKISLPTAPNGQGTALGDIDRDGKPDIIGNGYWLKQPSNPITETWTIYKISDWLDGSAVAVYDINNDGRIDVFLSPTERGTGKLAWFEAPVNPLTDTWIQHNLDDSRDHEDVHKFHIADINKDGKPDLVFAEMHQSPNHRVGVYYNKGNGASWAYGQIDTIGSHNIAIGDIDQDGDIDILGANWETSAPDGGHIYWWRNDLGAKLSLDQWTYIPVDNTRGSADFGLNFGDIDGDGLKDIVAGHYWYRNSGGTLENAWSRVSFPGDNDAMLVMDVNSDGRLDVIAQGTPNDMGVPIHWLKPTDALATSWDSVLIGTIPRDPADGRSQGYSLGQIIAGDKPELVFSSMGIHYFQIPADPSKSNWPQVQITNQAREEGIALADMDGDGDLDVAGLVAPAGTTVAWWENPGNGTANWPQRNLGTTEVEADRVAIADINGDGKLDVIVTETNLSTSGNAAYWFAQPTDPRSNNWTRTPITSNQGSLNAMDVADMNGDGLPDIITGEHRGSLKVTVWENSNKGASWTAHTVSTGRESHLGARIIDLDGDGDLDIVSIAWDSKQYLHVFRNNAIP